MPGSSLGLTRLAGRSDMKDKERKNEKKEKKKEKEKEERKKITPGY